MKTIFKIDIADANNNASLDDSLSQSLSQRLRQSQRQSLRQNYTNCKTQKVKIFIFQQAV